MFAPMRAVVRKTQRLSPHFVRVWFGGQELAKLKAPAKTFDQRIKLLLPGQGGQLPTLRGDNWYQDWLATEEEQRGFLRTYTIRDVAGVDPFLAVDFVAHDEGVAGPWAAAAVPGDEIIVVGPTGGEDCGGIEFDPQPHHQRVLLAGDESAVPAMLRIAEELPSDTQGLILCEVPTAHDILPSRGPAGVRIQWLPRGHGQQVGELLIPAVLASMSGTAQASSDTAVLLPAEEDPEGMMVWETARFSAAGEELVDTGAHGQTYFWIAGESSVVTGLRRTLVRERGIARSDVAFMGYWKRGVSLG